MQKLILLLGVFLTLGLASADDIPLVASYAMSAGSDPTKLTDQSGTNSDGDLQPGAKFANDPDRGSVLQLDGTNGFVEVKHHHLIDRLGMELTCTAWIKTDGLPSLHKTYAILIKGSQGDCPFKFSVSDNGALHFDGAVGGSETSLNSHPHTIEPAKWHYVALTYKAGDEMALYIDGQQAAHGNARLPLQPNEQGLFIGIDGKSDHFSGEIGAIHLYAQALTADEIAQDQNGGLSTRPATEADMPPVLYPAHISLGRYDMPEANTQGYGRIHQIAQRQPGPDAVDWPQVTLDGKPLFQTGDSAEDIQFIRKRTGAEAMSKFEQAGDDIIEPGHHWLRPLAWRWGRNFVYTDDRYARSFTVDYELWVFPIQIEGPGQQDVHDVELKYQGQTIYQQPGPFHSLTLLLPANAPGTPYTLTVAGRTPVTFDVGLEPVQLGHPKDIVKSVDLAFSGTGPKITVKNLDRPQTFPQQADWDKDTAALAAYAPDSFEPAPQPASMQSRIGISVPRSPLTVNAISLPAGMSGGFFYNGDDGHGTTHAFPGTADDYGHYLSDIGYDRVFEFDSLGGKALASDPRSHDAVAAALAHSGVQFGIVPGEGWYRPSIDHANISLFAWTLPDFCQPLYRSLQIQAQRFQRYGNFAGLSIGADNGGYVSYWNWAPPIPDRPWPTAMNALFQGQPVRIPVSPAITGSMEAKEYKAANVKEVVDFLAKYDETFTDFNYFDKALKEVSPNAKATCGMFGSSPGGLGRGGWPMGSIPGKQIFSGLDVQQAYDWNEMTSSLPMHNVALLDRIRSYDPKKTTWALIDDFNFLLDRGERQRAYALALTRGIQAIGTTYEANPTGDRARPEILADQKELYAWIHRYGGAYEMSQPEATIGILYVHPQALLRGIAGDAPDEVLHGSHEGKTTEALFLCHAAGWPARIITPEELKRGIDPGMKAILLVGLNQFDNSWNWYDGLTDSLKQYVAQGGRILLDDESVCPVPATSTGMQVNAYVAQSLLDQTPDLIARNTDNFAKLNQAMANIPRPVCTSGDPTVWTVPTRAGDTEYVTVVNQLMDTAPLPDKPDKMRSVMKGQTGTVAWNTTRPIYDVRLGRLVTPAEAAKVDLTHDAFQWFALPPEPVSAPSIALSDDADGYKQAVVSMAGKSGMSGIPIELTIKSAQETVTLYTATGLPTRLPVKSDDNFGACDMTATELLSGLSGHASLQTSGSPASNPQTNSAVIQVVRADDVKQFGTRRDQPLTIALTDKQAADPQIKQLADTVADYYRGLGRTVELGRAEPNQFVLSRQPYIMTQPYPQWKTAESDVVLFGSPNDNVLLMDQDRGYLLPQGIDKLAPAHGIVCLTYSPFVGECQAINFVAHDIDGLKAAVKALTRTTDVTSSSAQH